MRTTLAEVTNTATVREFQDFTSSEGQLNTSMEFGGNLFPIHHPSLFVAACVQVPKQHMVSVQVQMPWKLYCTIMSGTCLHLFHTLPQIITKVTSEKSLPSHIHPMIGFHRQCTK